MRTMFRFLGGSTRADHMKDFIVTGLIAEFINTLTNIFYGKLSCHDSAAPS